MQGENAYVGRSEGFEMLNQRVGSQEFSQILASGIPSLYRRAYRLLGNSADAEDAVQDALLAAHMHLNQFKGQSQMSTWLTAIVHNCARMQLRRRSRHLHVPLEETIGEAQERPVEERLADRRPSPEDEYRHSELSRRLSLSQRQLTPRLRRTFQLRDVDGLSVRETAQILGVPNGTVKAQTARAREKLKQVMRRDLRPQPRTLAVASAQLT